VRDLDGAAMTIAEFLSWHWTWMELFNATAHVIFLATTAFFAGYWRGRRAEMKSSWARDRKVQP